MILLVGLQIKLVGQAVKESEKLLCIALGKLGKHFIFFESNDKTNNEDGSFGKQYNLFESQYSAINDSGSIGN